MSEFPRDLNLRERVILEFLLSRPFPGRDELMQQLASVKVFGKCQCGCETVDLTVDEANSLRARVKERIPVEAITRSGSCVNVLLHVVNGFLRELEVVGYDPDEPARLPESNVMELIIK